MQIQLKCAFWNIGGHLATKLLDPSFRQILAQHDIIFLLETWLREDEEAILNLPRGFSILAYSRPVRHYASSGTGGAAVLYRTTTNVSPLPHLCLPDLAVVEVDETYLMIGAYLCPATSPWRAVAENIPEDALADAITWCTTHGEGRRLLVGGDFNLRLKNEQTLGAPYPRRYLDTASRTTRGKWLLDMARLHRLFIVNGSLVDEDSPGLYTSWQPRGKAVVDYVLAQSHIPLPRASFRARSTSWSDHSVLGIDLYCTTLDTPTPLPNHTPTPPACVASSTRNVDAPLRPLWMKDNKEAGDRLQRTLNMACSGQIATRHLYGDAAVTQDTLSTSPRSAYIASYSTTVKGEGRSATYALAWNQSLPTSGAVMTPYGISKFHGELFALTIVVQSYKNVPLAVYTSSRRLISLVCYQMPRLHELGFPGDSGPLLRTFVKAMRGRTGSIILRDDSRRSTKDRLAMLRLEARQAWNRRAPETIINDNCEMTFSPCVLRGNPKVGSTSMQPPLSQEREESREYLVRNDMARGTPVPARAMFLVRRIQAENRARLLAARNSKEWWRIIRTLTSPKSRPSQVTVDQLRHSFFRRLNPSPSPPPHFDPCHKAILDDLAESIPSHTIDESPEGFFSRHFRVEEMAFIKRRIADRINAATGLDRIAYTKIMTIPNSALMELFNYFLDQRTIPQDWLITVLVGILKKGKEARDPESYRLVGLESCLLKVFTLLIETRIVNWAEARTIIPDSQNGFRTGRRASTNPFILSCAIDRAAAQNKKLYVVFVDLTNAFPATDLSRLWVKLASYGVSGPLFDWLRMLYAKMRYVVRQDGDLTPVEDAFRSLIGVLTGDSASPILWNIYFADVAEAIPVHPEDIVFLNQTVSHVEHADDVALWSTSLPALQHKLDTFYRWCTRAFMSLSVTKTEWMVFGGSPSPQQGLYVDGILLKLVQKYKFIGIWFSSKGGATGRFREHFVAKSAKARAMSSVLFSAGDQLGHLEPRDALAIYWSMVDPHLMFGSDFILDDVASHFTLLDDVQKYFLRKVLGVSERSPVFARYTETGVMPLRYRRILSALTFFRRVLVPKEGGSSVGYAQPAALDLLVLDAEGRRSWLSRLRRVLAQLPMAVALPSLTTNDLCSEAWHRKLYADVRESCHMWLRSEIMASNKCHLLCLRWTRLGDGFSEGGVPLLRLRDYLKTGRPEHRIALTKLLLSDHPLAVEVLRRGSRSKPAGVPREARKCRFCHKAVEDESHALVECEANSSLVHARAAFLDDIWRYYPKLKILLLRKPVLAPSCLPLWLSSPDLTRRLGTFVHTVFAIFEATPYPLDLGQSEETDPC